MEQLKYSRQSTPSCDCAIVRLNETTYSVSASRRHVLAIRKFQQLSPTWQLTVERFMDSILEAENITNVIKFPQASN